MSFVRNGNRGLLMKAPPRTIALGPTLTPVPLSAAFVTTGHSLINYWINWWERLVVDSGATPDIDASTGAFASAKGRWENDWAGPDQVRSLMEAPGATYDLFLGIEAHGGAYPIGGSPTRASVETNTTEYASPTPADAYVYALLWHNLAGSTGAQTAYANFWQDDTALLFGAAWRAAQNGEMVLWDTIIDYVNANRDSGTLPMILVPFLQVFCAIYDAIEADELTGMTMADFFADNVHPSALGIYVQLCTVMAVMFQRHPDQVLTTISAEFEFETDFAVDAGLAAQLRPLIWSTCLATARTGLPSV